jgi:hypothetical protein
MFESLIPSLADIAFAFRMIVAFLLALLFLGLVAAVVAVVAGIFLAIGRFFKRIKHALDAAEIALTKLLSRFLPRWINSANISKLIMISITLLITVYAIGFSVSVVSNVINRFAR